MSRRTALSWKLRLSDPACDSTGALGRSSDSQYDRNSRAANVCGILKCAARDAVIDTSCCNGYTYQIQITGDSNLERAQPRGRSDIRRLRPLQMPPY
jgi:hypothetical protein